MANLVDETDLPQKPPDTFEYSMLKCHFPGCNASYRRKEHLHRHAAKHSQRQVFLCSNCGREFGRSDTLRRHVRRRHNIIEPPTRALRACESCRTEKSRCEGGVPCSKCLRRKIQCSLNDHGGTVDKQCPGSSTTRASSPRHEESHFSLSEKKEQYIDLYFEAFHPYWPFIHKGSFNIRHEIPLLVQSMLVMGLWASGEQPAQSAAASLHCRLDLAIRDQKEKWDASKVDDACSSSSWPIATYQAILLHIISSFVFKSRDALDFDLKISLSSADFELLETLVRSCRRLGMFYYPNILARYRETDLASFVWVGIEEIKRFNLALYKACGKLRNPGTRDGSKDDVGAVTSLLAASELQFPPPTNHPLWNAVGKDEWMAHTKDERLLSLHDNDHTNWISNFAGVLEILDL